MELWADALPLAPWGSGLAGMGFRPKGAPIAPFAEVQWMLHGAN